METLSALSAVIRDLCVALAALVGAFLAWQRLRPAKAQADAAEVQAQLARRSHVVELFNRAAGQLRDPNLEVRLAAVYVLREIGEDFPDLADPVFQLLQAYLRENPQLEDGKQPSIDVREIVEIVRQRLGDA